MTKKTYKVKGMDCASCATLIELDLEDAGVKAYCRYASETLDVEFDDNKVNEEKIKEIVERAGYDLS